MGDEAQEIPEYLREAAQIFLNEMRDHVAHFDRQLGGCDVTPAVVREWIAANGAQARERFHLMKGGAGFLSLTRIRDAAHRGEAILKSSGAGGSITLEEAAEIIHALAELRRGLSDLEHDLA